VPALPYHQDLRYTSRDNRYPPYNTLVESSDKIAYITSLNPILDEKIRSGFLSLGLAWQEEKIGDFLVFYDLSRPIRPSDLDLTLQPVVDP
jgi:hypothetical protein